MEVKYVEKEDSLRKISKERKQKAELVHSLVFRVPPKASEAKAAERHENRPLGLSLSCS